MKVLVTGIIPEEVMSLIQKEHLVEANTEDRPIARERLLQAIADKDGLLCMITDAIDAGLLAQAPRLKMVANFGVGYNNIDVAEATRRSILVSNTPDVLTDATADVTFALILAVARRVVEGDSVTRKGEFRFWAPYHFLGREVSGKTLGIIGLGRIGRAVARRAKGFDMEVLYDNRHRLENIEEQTLGVRFAGMSELLAEADFVSLHVPLSQETHHLIDKEALHQMKSSAFLINTSRGPVVDEKALGEALKAGTIAGAGLDVYENEPDLTPGLTGLSNVVLLPHTGSATLETRTKMARLAADNLLEGLRGEKPPNCLNWVSA